jgi:hypothetical protein
MSVMQKGTDSSICSAKGHTKQHLSWEVVHVAIFVMQKVHVA